MWLLCGEWSRESEGGGWGEHQGVSGGDGVGWADAVLFAGRMDRTFQWLRVMSSRKATVVICSGHAVLGDSAPGRREWRSEA